MTIPRPLLLVVAAALLVTVPPPAARAADDDFARGNAAYQDGRFAEAAGAYERALKTPGDRGVGVNVFYNLGNAYARLEQRGRAAASYRRALLRDPQHADAAANLALVRRQLRVPTDAVLPPALPAWLTDRLPPAALVWGGNAAAWVAAFGGWLFLVGLVLVLFRPRRGETTVRRQGAGLGLTLALAAGLPLALLGAGAAWTLGRPVREATGTAVVVARRADAHEQPADNARTVGTLTEGCEVRLILARGPWSYVTLADGRHGFVPADRLEVVGGG